MMRGREGAAAGVTKEREVRKGSTKPNSRHSEIVTDEAVVSGEGNTGRRRRQDGLGLSVV
jgi:hypothetical protein